MRQQTPASAKRAARVCSAARRWLRRRSLGRLRQSGHQRAQSLGRHVVGNEKFRIGEGGANRKGDGIGIVLVDRRRSGFQFVDDDGGFFSGNQLCCRKRPPSWLTTCW